MKKVESCPFALTAYEEASGKLCDGDFFFVLEALAQCGSCRSPGTKTEAELIDLARLHCADIADYIAALIAWK